MDETRAVIALQALAQPTRLQVVRLLIAAGPNGLPAGAIAERVGVQPSTLSFHLRELDRAELVRSWRRAQRIFYAVEFETMRQLLSFLTEACCNGHPEICGGLLQPIREVTAAAGSCRGAAASEGCRDR